MAAAATASAVSSVVEDSRERFVVNDGVLDGGGDTVFDMYSLAVCMWGLAIPLALLGAFVFGWPVLAVYACTCLDEVGKIPWVMYRFGKYKWVKNLTREQLAPLNALLKFRLLKSGMQLKKKIITNIIVPQYMYFFANKLVEEVI